MEDGNRPLAERNGIASDSSEFEDPVLRNACSWWAAEGVLPRRFVMCRRRVEPGYGSRHRIAHGAPPPSEMSNGILVTAIALESPSEAVTDEADQSEGKTADADRWSG